MLGQQRRPQQAARPQAHGDVHARVLQQFTVEGHAVGGGGAEAGAALQLRRVQSACEAGQQRFGADEIGGVVFDARPALRIVDLEGRTEKKSAVRQRRHHAVAVHRHRGPTGCRHKAQLAAHRNER